MSVLMFHKNETLTPLHLIIVMIRMVIFKRHGIVRLMDILAASSGTRLLELFHQVFFPYTEVEQILIIFYLLWLTLAIKIYNTTGTHQLKNVFMAVLLRNQKILYDIDREKTNLFVCSCLLIFNIGLHNVQQLLSKKGWTLKHSIWHDILSLSQKNYPRCKSQWAKIIQKEVTWHTW